MNDIAGRIFAIIFGSVFLFIVPIAGIAVKQDNISQTVIDNAIVCFVDNARSTGKITESGYEEMCRKIDATGVICEVDIVHSAKFYYPTKDDAGNYNAYNSYYEDFATGDILGTLYDSNKEYKMKNGDLLTVSVRNTVPTLGARMYSMFLAQGYDNSVYATYCGYVGNEAQD